MKDPSKERKAAVYSFSPRESRETLIIIAKKTIAINSISISIQFIAHSINRDFPLAYLVKNEPLPYFVHMKIYDMHCHSHYSEDCEVHLEKMCQSAIDKGLKAIAFAEHVDYNPADKGYGYFQKDDFCRGIASAQQKYGERIKILQGMEFSEPHLYPEEYNKDSQGSWDVIIGSLHMLDDHFVGEPVIQELYKRDQLYIRYFSDMRDMVRSGGFDILAHMDFPKRYHGEPVYHHNLIDEILEELIEKGIALEINTSPLRKGMDACSPDREIIKRYAELGGSRITFGSDAHRQEEIGADYDKVLSFCRDFPALTLGYFEKRIFIEY